MFSAALSLEEIQFAMVSASGRCDGKKRSERQNQVVIKETVLFKEELCGVQNIKWNETTIFC
jgi:hypothetical protein